MATRNFPAYADPDGLLAALKKQAKRSLSAKSQQIQLSAWWLVKGGLGADVWLIKERDDAPLPEIDFRVRLPNNTLLTSPENVKCLVVIQRIFFAIRNGHVARKANQATCLRLLKWLFKLTEWVYLDEEKFRPREFAFGLIDDEAIEALLDMLSEGSWSSALRITPRSLDLIHNLTYGYPAPDSYHHTPLELPSEFVSDAKAALQKLGYYTGVNGIISRAKLSQKLSSPIFNGDTKLRLFLKQFEPEQSQSRFLVRANNTINKHIDSRSAKLSEAGSKETFEKTFGTHLDQLYAFMQSKHIDPDSFPALEIDKVALREYKSIYSDRLAVSRHTPKIPYGIGMHVLGSAIEWVVLYGNAFVDMAIHAAREVESGTPLPELGKNIRNWAAKYTTAEYPGYPSTPLCEALNINRLLVDPKNPSNRSFAYHLSAFIGSCAVLIGMNKPIRQQELASIKRSGLSTRSATSTPFSELSGSTPTGLTEELYENAVFDTGAFLTHINKKAGAAGLESKISRPIPYIAAVAVQLLQRLGDGLSTAYKDSSNKNDLLFYFPSLRDFSLTQHRFLHIRIDDALIRFSDAINVPIERDGTRWYVRTHEMRKFFIYTMFYHETAYSADAIGWCAGHSSAKEIDSYLNANGFHDEILEIQTESVVEKLLAHEFSKSATTDARGLCELHKSVLNQFGVKTIKCLPQVKFHDFVRRMIFERKVETIGYTVVREMLDGSILDTDIAIKFGDKADAKYVPR
ncbi:hypothetical protein [Pseudomonas fluorescens]|uniref:Integrase n=1 Tax=Pseudomonas fluorescens TaxID=294 RepID=A0A5E7G2A3_PSEFL|nr:hypothetical protein [Pseudomonas fluorescens]VVO45244.1 hypothetical protein PS833_06630 [Pseudomonas fluorescens]